MTYQELKQKQQNKLTILNNEVGLFWAFNKEQLTEGVKNNPSIMKKYISIGMGGYLPKENIDKFTKGLKTISQWFKEEKKKLKKEKVILYELNNYECFYTGELDNAYDVLKDTYTIDEIREVYKKYKNQVEV